MCKNKMFLSKSGFWYILSLCIIIHPGSSNPIEPGGSDATFVINEIAGNLDGHSYMELFSKDGINVGEPFASKFAVTLLQVQNSRIIVHSIYELAIDERPAGFYFVIGDAKEEWKLNPDHYESMTAATPGRDKKIFGNLEEFLRISENAQVIILTKSTMSISFVWPSAHVDGRQRAMYIEHTPSAFQEYLKDNQIDATILRSHGSSRLSTKLIQLLPKMNRNIPYLTATQGFKWGVNLSWNRCGAGTFDHQHFKTGELSPGSPNDCTKTRFISGSESNDQETQAVSDEVINDEGIADADLFDQMTQQEPGTCSRSSLRTDFAGELLTVEVNEAKRRKIARDPESDELPDSLLDPETAEKKAKIATAIQHMEQYQPHQFATNSIENYWEWFQYNFNETNPEASTYNCMQCTTYLRGTKFSNILANEVGILQATKEQNMRTIWDHPATLSHQKALQLEAIEKNRLGKAVIAEDIKRKIDEENEVNEHIVLLTYFCARNYNSFQFFTRLVELFERVGVFMGSTCRDPKAAADVSVIIADIIKEDFVDEFNALDGPVQLILDGSEAKNHRHQVVLLFQHIGTKYLHYNFDCFVIIKVPFR